MMETIKQKIFTDWHVMRWIRLIIGIIFIIESIRMHDTFMGLAGAFFLFTAFANIGCCGTNQCRTPIQQSKKVAPEEISFEEVEKN